MTSLSFVFWLLVYMTIVTLTSPYHPDLALVAINAAFAVGCAIEGIVAWRQV